MKCIKWTRKTARKARPNTTFKERMSKIGLSLKELYRDLWLATALTAFSEEAMGHNAMRQASGQRQWTDFYPNGDFSESILNSSFDWNGIREAFVLATENDSLNGVAMLFGKLLTNTPQVFADVRTYWSPDAVKRVTGHTLSGIAKDGFIHLLNSGSAAIDGAGEMTKDSAPAMKPFWEITPQEAKACLDATPWRAANAGYFRGGGFSSNFTTKGGMPVTLARINLIKGLGPVLQLAEGYTIDLPEDVHKTIMDRTDPTWPCTWFVPRLTGKGAFKDVYSVMNNWGANHGSFSYGHIEQVVPSMLKYPYACTMSTGQNFPTLVWNAFGMDKTGHRACQNLTSQVSIRKPNYIRFRAPFGKCGRLLCKKINIKGIIFMTLRTFSLKLYFR